MAFLITAPPLQEQQRASRSALESYLRRLLSWRTDFSFGWLEASVLALYCGVLALVIPGHEPWDDEAQAWLIARDNSVWQMIRHRLHYEGAPPLWHILLHVFHLAHGSYAGIGWFGASFAIAGVFVLLRWSPFPLVVRVLLPFTFFLQYQYAVVARSYNLFPLLVFGLCALYRKRQKVVWFAFIAGLLANLCMQGIEFASVLCVLFLWDAYRDSKHGFPVPWSKIATAGALYTIMAGVACYTAMPAPDVNFAVTGTVSEGMAHKLLVRFIGESPHLYSTPAEPDAVLPPPAEPAQPEMASSPRAWLAWQLNHRDVDTEGFPRPETFGRSVVEFLVGLASQATWPVAVSNALACVFLALLFLWMRARRSVRMLLPWVALIFVGQILWVVDHHAGMLLIALMASMWLAAERYADRPLLSKLDVGLTSVLAMVLILQVGWSYSCIRKDIRGAYDPSRETAAFLQQHPVAKTAAFHFWSVSIQPYFAKNPFFNIPHRYWLWSWNANPDPYYRAALAQHPDRVVYSVEFPGRGQMRNQWIPLNRLPSDSDMRNLPWDLLLSYFHSHGYVETHRFCGTRWARLSSSYIDCDLILEPDKNYRQ